MQLNTLLIKCTPQMTANTQITQVIERLTTVKASNWVKPCMLSKSILLDVLLRSVPSIQLVLKKR